MRLAGGNCNNGANYGSWYLNVNNRTTNWNWNIGTSVHLSYRFYLFYCRIREPYLMVKIVSRKEWLSKTTCPNGQLDDRYEII